MCTRVNECSVKYFTCLSPFLGYLFCFRPSAGVCYHCPCEHARSHPALGQFGNGLQKMNFQVNILVPVLGKLEGEV